MQPRYWSAQHFFFRSWSACGFILIIIVICFFLLTVYPKVTLAKKFFVGQLMGNRTTFLSNLEVLRIYLIQLFPNWTACSPITFTNCYSYSHPDMPQHFTAILRLFYMWGITGTILFIYSKWLLLGIIQDGAFEPWGLNKIHIMYVH